jgi:hypothetical protein
MGDATSSNAVLFVCTVSVKYLSQNIIPEIGSFVPLCTVKRKNATEILPPVLKTAVLILLKLCSSFPQALRSIRVGQFRKSNEGGA